MHDFVCGEVAWFLCVERLWDFFHSVTQAAWFIFSGVFLIYFLRRDCVIFWSDFFCGELAWFHLLRGCVILCVERLCDFSHSLTQVAWFIFFWGYVIFFAERLHDFFYERLRDFFVWRGWVIFCVKGVFLMKKVFWWKHFFVEFIFGSLLSLLSLLSL